MCFNCSVVLSVPVSVLPPLLLKCGSVLFKKGVVLCNSGNVCAGFEVERGSQGMLFIFSFLLTPFLVR